MLRISKLTDYGTVILAHMARHPGSIFSATHLARVLELPTSTVSKLLKRLARSGLLCSCRGKRGGYTLARPPAEIALSEVIEVLEGPAGLTECSRQRGLCRMESTCAIRRQWQGINAAVMATLQQLSLEALVSEEGGHAPVPLTE